MREKNLTYWQFPDLPIDFCDNEGSRALTLDHSKHNILPNSSFCDAVRRGGARRFFDGLH